MLSPLAQSLAMDAATVRRLCAASVGSMRLTPAERAAAEAAGQLALAPVVPFEQTCTLEQAAHRYLAHPTKPDGLAKQIAAETGVNYASLLQRIFLERKRHNFG